VPAERHNSLTEGSDINWHQGVIWTYALPPRQKKSGGDKKRDARVIRQKKIKRGRTCAKKRRLMVQDEPTKHKTKTHRAGGGCRPKQIKREGTTDFTRGKVEGVRLGGVRNQPRNTLNERKLGRKKKWILTRKTSSDAATAFSACYLHA